MKKITIFILVLSLALSLCACSKASRIPSLAEIAENGAEWSGEQIRQVQGCTLADLEKAWGKADGELPGEYAYFWKVDDTTSVNVYYHKNAEIERITVTSPKEGGGTDDGQQTGGTYSEEPFDIALSYANWTDANGLYTCALNVSKMAISSVQHLPICKFDTLEDLEQFRLTFGEVLSMDDGYDEIPSFNEVTRKYGKTFFEDNTLMLVYIGANNSAHRFWVNEIFCDGTAFCIHIEETTGAEAVDCAITGWFITVAVPDSMIANCQEFDADLVRIQMSLAQADGSSFDLSEENAKTLRQILDSGSWVSDATDCASDYVLTFDGRTVYYHSDCGTFNEQLEQGHQSLRLSDEQRETMNRIIQAVIPCDLSPNAPMEISYTDVWPVNTFTDDLPVPPGTVSWAALDEEYQSLAVNLTDMSETDYADYMKSLQQAGFSVIEGTSEDIEGQDYISTGVLLSNGEKNLSIGYIPGNFTIYISFME